MHWILLAVLAVILIITAFRYPKLAFSLLGVFVAIAAALYYLVDEQGQGQLETLGNTSVTIENIKMSPAYRDSFLATGTIVNHSRTHDITELSIRFSVNDCPEQSADDANDCTVIAQAIEPFRVHIPLDGRARFEESVAPRRVKVEGVRQWTFKVMEVKGRVPLRVLDE